MTIGGSLGPWVCKGFCISGSWILCQDHLGFLSAFLHMTAQQHEEHFVILQKFQPMTAKLVNVDCPAALLLVERYVDCRRTHFLLRRHMLPVHQNAREKPNVPSLKLPCLLFWLKVWPNTYKHILTAQQQTSNL